MLEYIKTVLRVKTNAYDLEIENLINAAKLDLGIAGIAIVDDALVNRAIATYCKMNFGECDNYDKLKASYDEQKAQLKIAGDYRADG